MKRLLTSFGVTSLGLSVMLVLLEGNAAAYSSLPGATLTRTFSPAKAQPGQAVTVTLTVKIGSLSSALRGFYVSEAVPAGLSTTSGKVTLNGSPLTVKMETTSVAAIYAGARTLRWVLEQPPSWSSNHPLPASATLVVTYTASIPSSASGSLSFPGASWVGMLPSLGDAGDHFGYEDKAATLMVTSSGPPPPVDGGAQKDQGSSEYDSSASGDGALHPPDGDGHGGPSRKGGDRLVGGCALNSDRTAGSFPWLFVWGTIVLFFRRRGS